MGKTAEMGKKAKSIPLHEVIACLRSYQPIVAWAVSRLVRVFLASFVVGRSKARGSSLVHTIGPERPKPERRTWRPPPDDIAAEDTTAIKGSGDADGAATDGKPSAEDKPVDSEKGDAGEEPAANGETKCAADVAQQESGKDDVVPGDPMNTEDAELGKPCTSPSCA